MASLGRTGLRDGLQARMPGGHGAGLVGVQRQVDRPNPPAAPRERVRQTL